MCRSGPLDANRDVCPGCAGASTRPPRFRCQECFGDLLYCEACIVDRHRENPLHRVRKWSGGTFVKVSLASLGLRVQVGHRVRKTCSVPIAANKNFVVLHENGIHEVAVDFCGCENELMAGPPDIQLLRAGWFPATHERPQTCATLVVLEKYHLETLQAKTTMYDFYGVLEKLTDNTGIKPPDRYHEWIRMCREYRHLMLLKRGGRAPSYATGGPAATGRGELAIQCPACPRPGVNLPEGWEDASPEDRFLYTLFLALDACFRLKRRLVSSELKDPDLGPGWAYMVETEPYRAYLRGVTDQKEMNTCSGLAALDYANTKFSRGYSTTGVGMGVCARHEFVQANGVGDLQKGERFANMDYIYASILTHKEPTLHKITSYDIACIWAKFIFDRLKALPANVRFTIIIGVMQFVIPKMHIHSHTLACQILFALTLLVGAAQVDGEAIERSWANIGGVASNTLDMGPGSRHDVLDCHWAFWNWVKLVGIYASLRRRMDRAKAEGPAQREAFETFSAEQRERVPDWKAAVLAFEADSDQPNPYEVVVTGLTESEVRLQFADEEAKEVVAGVPSLHDVSPSSFIFAGLDLEAEQRRVRVQAELKKAGTTEMQIDLSALRTKLNRGILRFRKLQRTYMPAALQVLGDKHLPDDILAEDVPLMLPSALSLAQRDACVAGLPEIESMMRDAQCRTALVRLRNQLHIKSRLLLYKGNHTRHQGSKTRAQTIVARNESKIRLHSEKYQAAWEALRRLNNGDESLVGWRVLKRDDIRCMEDPEDVARLEKERKEKAAKLRAKHQMLRDHGLLPAERDEDMDWEEGGGVGRGGENVRKVSWIWAVAGTEGTDAGLEEALRVEWAKAWARVRRWDEEERLLSVEYERVGMSFEYEARKWEERAKGIRYGVVPLAEAEGAAAYAKQQAAVYRDMVARGEKTWTEPRSARGKKKARHVPAAVAAMQAEERAEQEERREAAATTAAAAAEDSEDGEDDEVEDDDLAIFGERGDVASDEE
ncbi:hypothetical protein B0H11DRAFT_1732318 [Mycena galericulata]|nr:hypothetical protein B0H11DRAFT_1732318 [Mycena galericulata]